MTASQRKPRADGIERGPLVRIMPWGQAVQWQLPVLMAQAQVRFAKQLHDLLLGEGVTIGHSRVHELVTEAPARLTVEVQFALCRVLNCSPSAETGFNVVKVTPITAVWREVRAGDQVLALQRVTGRAVTAGYLTQAAADQWLDYLATQPFFASTTLFITTAIAA